MGGSALFCIFRSGQEIGKCERNKKKGLGKGTCRKPGSVSRPSSPDLLLSGSWGAVVDSPGADTQADAHGGLTQGSMVFHADTGITGAGSETTT